MPDKEGVRFQVTPTTVPSGTTLSEAVADYRWAMENGTQAACAASYSVMIAAMEDGTPQSEPGYVFDEPDYTNEEIEHYLECYADALGIPERLMEDPGETTFDLILNWMKGGYAAYIAERVTDIVFEAAHGDGAHGAQAGDILYRTELGKAVREVWLQYAHRNGDVKPSHIAPWDEMTPYEQEVDREIGEVLFAIGQAAGLKQSAYILEQASRAHIRERIHDVNDDVCARCAARLRTMFEHDNLEILGLAYSGLVAARSIASLANAAPPNPVNDRLAIWAQGFDELEPSIVTALKGKGTGNANT